MKTLLLVALFGLASGVYAQESVKNENTETVRTVTEKEITRELLNTVNPCPDCPVIPEDSELPKSPEVPQAEEETGE